MTNLAFDRVGSGPPLVLLHPLGADRKVWRPVLGALSATRECIAVDLPGFGQSAPLPGEASPRELASAVVALLEALGIGGGQAHLAGNSLGGWVALEVALQGCAASVTAIAPAGLWSRPLRPKLEIARRLARASRPLLARMLRSPGTRSAILRSSMAHPERVPAQAAAELVLAYVGASGFTAVNRAMRARVFGQLAEVNVPVTLVWPELDRIVKRPGNVPPSARQIELPGCGHIPMWDDPDTVAQALIAGSTPRVDSRWRATASIVVASASTSQRSARRDGST